MALARSTYVYNIVISDCTGAFRVNVNACECRSAQPHTIQCDAYARRVFAILCRHSQTSWLFMCENKLFKPFHNYCVDVRMFKMHPVLACVVLNTHAFASCVW